MASNNLFILKSYFGFINERFLSEFLYRTMFRYGNSLWGSLCAFMLTIFWFTAKFIPRLKPDFRPQEDDDQVVSLSSRNLEPEEKGSSEFYFSFLNQESKYSHGNFVEKTDGLAFQQSKYQFLSGKNVDGFVVQKPETMSFTVQEMFVGSSDFTISNDQNLVLVSTMNEHVKEGTNSEEKVAELDEKVHQNHDLGSTMNEHVKEGTNSGEKVAEFDKKVDQNLDLGSPMNGEVKEDSDLEEKVAEFDSEIASICSIEEHNLADINDLGDYPMEDDDISYEVQLLPSPVFSVKPRNLEVQSGGLFDEILKPEIIEDIAEGSDSEYIELKPNSKSMINNINEKLQTLDEDRMNSEDDSPERLRLEKEYWESYDSEDEDEDDILWEHQQFVQQKKMEMKNSKIKALPTISEEEEECETPKMMEENLKPLKIEPKFEYKDLLEEIHKFYKSYTEKMRKLDILNYQSLNAINIVQFKDSRVFVSSKKASFPHIKRLSSPSLWIGKQKRIFADPTLKSITEMQRDLELVYIGQVCLSWEILRWQYGKLKLLLEYDSQGHRSYNLVAGEYQQLQVLLQRFLEDEPFHGPRIQHYVKSRCFCRGLLQVPVIKDDCFKDKKDKLIEEQYAISIIELADIIRESMQVFSEFIRTDNKDETSRALKGVKGSPADHPDPAHDLELLINIRTCLEKKERKLKEIQRSANCIVKKFQKHQSSGRPSSAMFISQVELKLVSRVLNSSRLTTDQLLWCQKKLNNINIVNRKVHVEPVFLLFPC